jgi:hypothetical protein
MDHLYQGSERRVLMVLRRARQLRITSLLKKSAKVFLQSLDVLIDIAPVQQPGIGVSLDVGSKGFWQVCGYWRSGAVHWGQTDNRHLFGRSYVMSRAQVGREDKCM